MESQTFQRETPDDAESPENESSRDSDKPGELFEVGRWNKRPATLLAEPLHSIAGEPVVGKLFYPTI